MSDGLFFIGMFVFFFGAWLVGGGPSHPLSFSGPYISPITAGSVTGFGVPGSNEQISEAQGALAQDEQTVAQLQRQANVQALFGTPSPYKGQVVLRGGNAQDTDPTHQYVEVANVGSSNVTITGWKITSEATDRTIIIPPGDPLPGTGFASAKSPILLAPGQFAYLITASSPFGASFKNNECTGYLDPHNSVITPPLDMRCPSARDEFARFFTGNPYKDQGCYNLMQNIASCQVPPTNSGLSKACYSLIDTHLTYSGCVAAHQNDTSFGGNGWWVYLDYHNPDAKNHSVNDPLWLSTRDAIKLEDPNGLTVDLFTY